MTDTDPSPSSPESKWNVTTCASCGGKFKTPQDTSDTEMACPHCGEPVALSKSREPVEEDPIERTDPPLLTGDSPHDGTGSRRRRKTPKDIQEPAWDRDPAKGAYQGTMGTSEDEDVTEYYTGDPNDPESVRIKRVRRSKTLTGSQKFGRGLIIGTIAIVLLATGIAIALLVKEQVTVVAKEAQERRQLPEKVAQLVAEALAAKNESAILTEKEENACISIVNGFYSAKTIDEKLNFVRLPERVMPLLEKAYAGKPASEDIRIGEIVLSQKLVDKERRFITMAVSIGDSGLEFQLFAFEQKNETILMDWEVSSGYQQMPIQEFIARKVSEPTVFRVKLNSENYYTGEFQDKDLYQSVSLTYPGQPDFKLAGYISRQQLWADSLLARLELESPSLIVTLRYPPNAASAFEVEVTGIVLDSWFY